MLPMDSKVFSYSIILSRSTAHFVYTIIIIINTPWNGYDHHNVHVLEVVEHQNQRYYKQEEKSHHFHNW